MNDSALRQDVLDELEFEPSIDANDIGVAVEDGIVTLTGHVPFYSQRVAVERAVARLKGVKGIAQEIEVRHPGGAGSSDDEIAQRVVSTLKWSTLVPEEHVKVMVQKGWVTLTGALDWNFQKTGAENAICNLNGVTGVTNRIQLRERVSSRDVRKHIVAALHRNAALEADTITIDVVGNKVTLEGRVRTWSDRKVVEEAAWATSGVTAVDDRLAVG
jgi:osmotically-inducible protein OsmY